ncbi:MAG: O-antigen ligase family protein [Vicinamibacteria bacterium]
MSDFTTSRSRTELPDSAVSVPDDEGRLGWSIRGALLLLLIASPWPFGSATPVPSAYLSASIYVLFGIWVAFVLIRKTDLAFPWPGHRWLALGVLVGLLQLLPLAPGLVDVLAPASASIHYPAAAGVEQVLGHDWRPVSIEPFATEAELLRMGSLIAAFYLFGHLFVHRRDIRLLGYIVSFLGVALSLFAVYQQARWGTLLYGRYPVPSANPFGPFVNHNHFAGFVEMCALVALGGAIGHLGRRSQTVSILMGGSALFMGVALVLSRSRGGFLAAAAGAVILGALALRGKARTRVSVLAVWVGAVALLILFAAPSGVIERIGSIGRASEDVSMQYRLRLWSDSVRLALRSPVIGTGLGTYGAAIPPYRTDIDETRAEFAESDLVQLACEAGAAGLIVLGGLLLVAFRRSSEKLEEGSAASGSQGVLLGSIAAVFALLVHGLFDFNTHIPSNGLLFAGLLGTIAGSHPREVTPRAGSTLRAVAAFLICLVTVGAAGRSLTIGYSRDALVGVDPPRSEPEAFAELAARISASHDFAPHNPEGAFKLGVLYSEEAYRSPDARRYREIRFGQARDAFDEAVRLAPAQGRYWFELAWTEANLANDERADPLFEHALHLEPTSSRIRVNYALYLASRGRIEESLEHLERGRSLVPGISSYEAVSTIGPYVEDDLELLRRAAGEGPDAESDLERYLAERDSP